ncbi:hypothetical protein MVES_001553 [Malassezia vespertilionis]|uniref:Cytochrome b5 heme-binding domain-containing protein n=1 Tax=Malassezia vespertilionis TaxID=2020962 RepID=A0A2N1JCE9_9BASI|nr:hypothetical protein MVES_001553 [Malassezia vespertilionis]
MARKITFEELCQHNKPEDLWLLIDGKVYDVTAFLSEHPGGDEVMVVEAAKDATDPFEDVGHSEDAREQLVPMYLGDLVDMENVPKSGRAAYESEENPFLVLAGVVAAAGYFAYQKFVLNK